MILSSAIAAQAVLGLVEPQSSGLGGGAFIVYHDGKKTLSIDGRETAPAAAHPDWFKVNGKTLDWRSAYVGGKSVGSPGVIRAMADDHGALVLIEAEGDTSLRIDVLDGQHASARDFRLAAPA